MGSAQFFLLLFSVLKKLRGKNWGRGLDLFKFIFFCLKKMREKKWEKIGSDIFHQGGWGSGGDRPKKFFNFKSLLIEVKLGYPTNLSYLGHLELP